MIKKRSKTKLFFRWLFVIALVVAIVYELGNMALTGIRHLTRKPTAVVQANQVQSGVQAVMSREDFQKREENQAKQIYLQEQMTQLKSDYDAKNASLETQLESARQEELSFQ